MLQIISGKFFKSNERYDSIGQGILYSNASIFFDIETSIGKIIKISYSSGINTYLLSFQKGLEKPPKPLPGVMVATNDTDIINQFKYILTFGLKSFFDENKNNVYINSRTTSIDSNDILIPSRIIPRFFDLKIDLTQNEIDNFIYLFERILLLPRIQYKRLISCLQNFYNALQIINYNLDLSYALLIFSLESLSQNGHYQPDWKDYNEDKRTKLENLFKKNDFNKIYATQIKKILLKDTTFKLQKRFINFIINNITDSFFTSESKDIKNSITKLELEELLRNAYSFRSKHVHELEKLNRNLVYFSTSNSNYETFQSDNKKYLTFSGLLRLTHHVITNFIICNIAIKSEDINYYQELSGVLTLKLSYKYWISNPPKRIEELNHYFKNFCDMIINKLNNPKNDFFNMNNVFQFCINNINIATINQKSAILQMIMLYRDLTNIDKYDEFIKNNKYFSNIKSIYSLAIDLISQNTTNWNIEDTVVLLKNYFKNKYKKNSLILSGKIEVSLLLEIATKFAKKKNYDNYREYMKKALLELSGKYKIQLEIQNCINTNNTFDYRYIMFSEKYKRDNVRKLIRILKKQ